MNQHHSKKLFPLALLVVSLILISSCTTTKKKGDLGFFGKWYHNTTAHYNGYFNANILVEESVQKLNQAHRDNYNKLLPIYEYMALPDANPVASDLDKAIKKVSVVVNLHRPSKWTDDCYLIYGKANFLKQDYEAAEDGFSYLVDKYEPSKMEEREQQAKEQMSRKEQLKERREAIEERREARRDLAKKIRKLRKKGKYDKIKEAREEFEEEYGEDDEDEEESEESEEEKKSANSQEEEAPEVKSGFLKHQPAYQKGQLWLARTYIERDRHSQAFSLLTDLESEEALLEMVSKELPVVKAYYYIDRDEHSKAIPHLRTAISRSNDKERKARFSFILAQLYQREGQQQKAYAAFDEASNYTNNYDMAFAARLNVLRNAFASGERSAAETLEELDDMLADGKNKEYKDQIYYTKAEIALATEDKALAKRHLHSSLKNSSGSNLQRAESYYRLAELYYEEGAFVKSKNYYDSTLQVMPENDERYKEVEGLSQNLDAIAANLRIIRYQDSMLMLANLSKEEREEIARRIIEQQKKQKLKQKKQGQKVLPTATAKSTGPVASSSDKPSSFFAYNQRSLRKGVREFRDEWGDRPLEDNWRRSRRSDVGIAADTTIAAVEEELSREEVPEDKMKEIFQDVPMSSKEVSLAEKKIIDAYFNLGKLYRNRIERYDYSAEALETLVDRFPQNYHLLDALYYLYLDYLDLGKKDEAERIKQRIMADFPDSKYAKILTDPAYYKDRMDSRKKVVSYYDKTYQQFEQGLYQQALERIQQVDSIFVVPQDLTPKFDLLKAMCYGHTSGKESYVRALEKVIEEHEGTKEEIRAKEILRFLKGDDSAFNKEEVKLEEGQFLVEDDKLHYVIVILRNSDKVSLNEAKVHLSEFNKSNFDLKNLRISNIVLDVKEGTPLIIIRRFDNKSKAMEYYHNAERHPEQFMPKEAVFDVYAINQRNYRQVLKERSAAAYELFFEKHYLSE